VNFLLQVFFSLCKFFFYSKFSLFLCKHKGIIAWKCVNRDKRKFCDFLTKLFKLPLAANSKEEQKTWCVEEECHKGRRINAPKIPTLLN
jgi:acyl-ACP thioesterase